jgi:hypothetical protein
VPNVLLACNQEPHARAGANVTANGFLGADNSLQRFALESSIAAAAAEWYSSQRKDTSGIDQAAAAPSAQGREIVLEPPFAFCADRSGLVCSSGDIRYPHVLF